MGLSYKEAGVDIETGREVVNKIKDDVESTFTPEVLNGLGGFGGLFAPDLSGFEEPVLVAGTDGVGTKLKVAFRMGKHDTIGIDLVAMCVNDILSQGARPLFFLDYLASGKLDPEQLSQVVKGIACGCRQANCALIGGETAEMPDFYQPQEYDLAGFAVGMVDRSQVITGQSIKPGDKIIGLASNGLHSNGYSLVRKIFFAGEGFGVNDKIEGLDNTLGEELLKPTRIYVKPILQLLKEFKIKGIAHITGGGLPENIARILPVGIQAVIEKENWPVPAIFKIISRKGKVVQKEMFRTFNMGIGMILVVQENEVATIIKRAEELEEKAYLIGEITNDKEEVIIQ
ncbi:MAG: phosphoribosylformylglycinamidine cyclo-ligase [Bacillota bacterium]